MLIIFLIKILLDNIIDAHNIADKGTWAINLMHIFILIGGGLVLYVISQHISYLANEKQSMLVTSEMYSKLHNKISSLELACFENPVFQDMLLRAGREISYRPGLIVQSTIYIIQSLLSLIVVLAILSTFHWGLIPLLILALLPFLIIKIYFSSKIFKLMAGKTNEERMLTYLNRILTEPVFAKEIRQFNMKEHFIQRFRAALSARNNEIFKLHKGKAIKELFAQLLAIITIVFLTGLICIETASGFITAGAMIMYIFSLYRGFIYLQQFFHGISALYENNLFMNNFFELLSLKSTISVPVNPHPFPIRLASEIKVEKVTFQYSGSDKVILNQIDLVIPAGKIIALVGKNGAGKSTLVKLICGLYQPVKGTIKFDGIDIRNINHQELYRNIGVLFQDFVLYNLTAKENIQIGNIESDNIEKIKYAAAFTGIHDFMEKLPKGYDTILGKLFHGSEELSIGEWQKLALARVFYNDAQITILDEPTSTLDAASENEIMEKIFSMTKGKTTIIVSHRFSTVKKADYIYFLHQGNIVEQGTHNELMRKNGKYAAMFNLQASNYL